MPKLKKKTICIYLLILVALYIVIAVIPSVTGALTRTEVIRQGELTVKDDVKCYIVRDETVYAASESGNMKFDVKEGALIKRETKVLDFTPASSKRDKGKAGKYKKLIDSLGSDMIADSSHTSQRKGCFSFYIDGHENYFSPSNMKNMKEAGTEKKVREAVDVKRTFTEKGDPIYKISDNSSWYIVCWIDEADISKYETGSTLKVKLPEGTLQATVSDITQESSKWRVILKTNRYYKDFVKIRAEEGSVITADSEGLLISNGCVTTKNDVVGVYVKSTTDEYVFTPVNVLGTNGEQTLVSEGSFYNDKGNTVSTVEMYDEVLKNPESDEKGE
ncbi:MAG: HlyD family efflux transporter periplasmic adaptor subunit [Eubacteriaceae bacterium]|nr:HlyD family efflux transporter periplasmic adaptor subunit [Eubacteriaceae bacterium]